MQPLQRSCRLQQQLHVSTNAIAELLQPVPLLVLLLLPSLPLLLVLPCSRFMGAETAYSKQLQQYLCHNRLRQQLIRLCTRRAPSWA
jgi:hypothetical protein